MRLEGGLPDAVFLEILEVVDFGDVVFDVEFEADGSELLIFGVVVVGVYF